MKKAEAADLVNSISPDYSDDKTGIDYYSKQTVISIISAEIPSLNCKEIYDFTTQELMKIKSTEVAINAGHVKQSDLPAEFTDKLTPEYKEKLVNANKKAYNQLQTELNEWL